MKKWFYGVSIALVGGIGAGVALQWTPVVAVWHALTSVALWVWGALSYTVAFPLSILILIIAPYVILLVVLLWTFRSKEPGSTVQEISKAELNPVRHYTSDEIFGVIWMWRWVRRSESNSPDRIHAICPRKNCRSDLELIEYQNYLYCERCKFKRDVNGHSLLSDVERELISRARTGNWANAADRLKQLEEMNP